MDTRKIPPPAPDYGPPPKRHRARKVAILVALLVGLPALALAATYLFGVITGQTYVAESTANVTISNVVGSGLAGPTAGGVDCSTSGYVHDAPGQQTLNLAARAFRVKVNGQPPNPANDLGHCTITVTVANAQVTGAAPAQVSAVLDTPMPTGWVPTISDPVTIDPGTTGTITITLMAKGDAVGDVNATTPNFSGKLNVTIPPNGAGQ